MLAKTGPVAYVVGPDGDVLTIADLPPRNLARWMPRQKARLVAAVCGGLISLSEACERYSLSPEEFSGWKTLFDSAGLTGLRITRPPQRH
jgi:transposase-like protein